VETAAIAGDRAQSAGERPALSKSDRQTLDSLFAHPIAHNLEWRDIVGLFTKLGTVEHLPNNETSLRIGAEHQVLHRPHSKDLTTEEVMALRHFLTRGGLSGKNSSSPLSTADFLVAVDHHEARIYRMDLHPPADAAELTVKPYDPHGFLHHLTDKDQTRQHGERAAEDPGFYEGIGAALIQAVPHGHIVIVGHGKGHSDAAHHLQDWLRLHHAEIFQRIAGTITADLSALTPPQLLELGRELLTPGD
jgi:hypothetical protein